MATASASRKRSARNRRTLMDDGINLTEWRARHNMTMSALAKELSLANGLPISNWEKGKSYPRAETLYRLRQIMEAHDNGVAGLGIGATMPGGSVVEIDVSSFSVERDGDIMVHDEDR